MECSIRAVGVSFPKLGSDRIICLYSLYQIYIDFIDCILFKGFDRHVSRFVDELDGPGVMGRRFAHTFARLPGGNGLVTALRGNASQIAIASRRVRHAMLLGDWVGGVARISRIDIHPPNREDVRGFISNDEIPPNSPMGGGYAQFRRKCVSLSADNPSWGVWIVVAWKTYYSRHPLRQVGRAWVAEKIPT